MTYKPACTLQSNPLRTDGKLNVLSNKHPLTPPLDELVKQNPNILQHEPADIESEELRRVPGAKLQTDVRL